MVAEHDGEGSF